MASVPAGEMFAYHVGDVNDVDHVANNGFDVKHAKGFRFGRGVYFSEHPACKIGYEGSGLILCRLMPGNEMLDDSTKLIKDDCHSKRVPARGGATEEVVVVENSSQILPCYVIHLER